MDERRQGADVAETFSKFKGQKAAILIGPEGGFSNEETRATSRFVMDDNTLELSSMSLEYRWDNQWLRNMTHLQSITFGININNLFYWSSVKQERGIDYPFARNLQGSIRFLF